MFEPNAFIVSARCTFSDICYLWVNYLKYFNNGEKRNLSRTYSKYGRLCKVCIQSAFTENKIGMTRKESRVKKSVNFTAISVSVRKISYVKQLEVKVLITHQFWNRHKKSRVENDMRIGCIFYVVYFSNFYHSFN